MRPLDAGRVLVAGALAASLAGCAAGPAPSDHFYRLEAVPPSATLESPALLGTLEVRRLGSDALTGERPLLYSESGDSSQLHRHDYHRWADSPTTMIQAELVAYLRAAAAASVVATPDMRVEADWVVSGRIVRLERVLGGSPPRVVVELQLSVVREKGRELVLLESYREELEAGGSGIGRSVEGFNRALGAIFERFLADLRR